MPVNIQALGLPAKRLVLSYIFDWIVIMYGRSIHPFRFVPTIN